MAYYKVVTKLVDEDEFTTLWEGEYIADYIGLVAYKEGFEVPFLSILLEYDKKDGNLITNELIEDNS